MAQHRIVHYGPDDQKVEVAFTEYTQGGLHTALRLLQDRVEMLYDQRPLMERLREQFERETG